MAFGEAIALILAPGLAEAQTVGPGTITSTVNVTSGITTVVGNTTISTAGSTPATNVTGGMLTFDLTAGPSPGAIIVQSVNGNGVQTNGGAVDVTHGINVFTRGGHAFLANGTGSFIDISGAVIGTTGVGAGLVAIGGQIDALGVDINNTATATTNISAGHGVIAESGGTINLGAASSVTTNAFNSVGLGASGAGSLVNVNAPVPVTMNGRGAMGIYLHDGGQVSLLPASKLQLNGTSSVGIAVDNTSVALGTLGSGLTINLDGVHVAGQAGSTGVAAFNGGTIALENLTVQGANAAAGAWARAGSSITLSGQSVINIDALSNPTFYRLQTANLVTPVGSVGSIFATTSGIPLAGLKADSGSIISIGTTINVTSGNGAAGVNAIFDGTVDMTDNTITTTGANSFGVRVDSGQVTGLDSGITTSGGGAALFFNFGPGSIDLTNTTVLAAGAGTSGLASLNGTPRSVNTVSLSGGSLVSEEQTAIIAQGPLDVTTNGTVVTGAGGFLLEAFNQSSFFPQQTAVHLNASGGSVLTGDAFVDTASTADISLSTGSQWTGAAFDVTNVTVDPTSTWTITDSSTVTENVSNVGLIEFAAPAGDPTQLASYKTLTTQNYVGQDGRLGLSTFLEEDSSPSNRLVIDSGTASGTSGIIVTNTTGAGALTTGDGILVVQGINGGATESGAFHLAGPAVAGPYEYTLHRGAAAGSENDWFLR
ncbi:hypothetical protein, partial [Mesorhizobium sp.]|uniref:hypothetical protein n=1 Tax=Mesorhizobium sp. TaxID=1871066 RepID=UPI0012171B42